ncbi:MAG: BlaI/MecI/CopY family transcriptional regulator, partial [Bacteroidota bacterium]
MSQENLSRRERQIMDILYQKSPLTAKEVQDNMSDAPTYTTV